MKEYSDVLQERYNLSKNDFVNKYKYHCLRTFCLVTIMTVILIFIVFTAIMKDESYKKSSSNILENCNIQIVESIPEDLTYPDDSCKFMSTFDAWKTLLNTAKTSVNIASYYWTLRGTDVINHTSASQGEYIFDRILSNAKLKNLNIRIVQEIPNKNYPNVDTELFVNAGAAEVRSINFTRLEGSGILHTKLWIVDNKHFYLGSANMDWRSLTQVKELGVLALNCSLLAKDVNKIFETYWYLSVNTSTIPNHWPIQYSTKYNFHNPALIKYNNEYTMTSYFSSSPPPLSADGRTQDIDAIISTILSAESFVNIAVMDYFPLYIYGEYKKYWPVIDDALRTAAINKNITVKMLISWWPHSDASEDNFLRSLASLSYPLNGVQIEIKRFIVPTTEDQKKIPFSRVNHNKYMVTDKVAYVGTSNWSADYFTNTAGIGLVLGNTLLEKNLRTELLSVFKRDWDSPYAISI